MINLHLPSRSVGGNHVQIFVNSMSDLFQEGVPLDFLKRIWDVMAKTPRHTYQILTKRPDLMADALTSDLFPILPNVWLGTSVEDSSVFSGSMTFAGCRPPCVLSRSSR